MASRTTRTMKMLGIAIPTSMAVLAMGPGTARAATTYDLYGSDTLTQVIKDAIAGSGAHINYVNTGSGQGEKNIANLGGLTVKQSIAPMSRNFVPSILSQSTIFPVSDKNVLCLDAGVVAFSNIGGHAVDVPCSSLSGSAVCDVTCDVNVNPLAIALGGYPSSCTSPSSTPTTPSASTTPECAHPQRLAAIAKLQAFQGARLDHYFRRDDKSGTQDSFREYLQFSRWCNGKAEGNVNAVGSNLKNEDLDPVRTPCSTFAGDANNAPSRCTFYPLEFPPVGFTCNNGDTLGAGATVTNPAGGTFTNPYNFAIKCTQGWVVALSENDPHQADITKSIGQRVAASKSGGGHYMGGAGLAVQATDLADSYGVSLNTVSFAYDSIAGGHYPMWRRLFLQQRADGANYVSADTGRITEENTLFNWATNRNNVAAICENDGFYAPLGNPPSSNCPPSNVTCLPAAAGLSTPKMNIGGETTPCDSAYPCVANGQTLSGTSCGGTGSNCPAIPAEGAGYSCNADAGGSHLCSSGTCQSTFVCQ